MRDEALKLALEGAANYIDVLGGDSRKYRQALAAQPAPVQEPKCNPHPKAPHGFSRNASHSADRYVCECEGWDAYDAGYQAGIEDTYKRMDALDKMAENARELGLDYAPAPVQVSPLEFVTMVMEKEHLVGKPLFWAEWPNKEKNT